MLPTFKCREARFCYESTWSTVKIVSKGSNPMARSRGPNFEGLTVCQPSSIDSSKMSISMRKMKNWRRLEIY